MEVGLEVEMVVGQADVQEVEKVAGLEVELEAGLEVELVVVQEVVLGD